MEIVKIASAFVAVIVVMSLMAYYGPKKWDDPQWSTQIESSSTP